MKSRLPLRAALAKGPPTMDTRRISDIALDEATILWRNADVEQERRVAIYDLIEENSFEPVRSAERGLTGPWKLHLSVSEGRLQMAIRDGNDEPAETLLLGLAAFRR